MITGDHFSRGSVATAGLGTIDVNAEDKEVKSAARR